jgi:MraZ protein
MSEVRASYTGSYEHAFDPKGRVTIPSEWREEPFEKTLYVFPSKEKCLGVYPASWLARLQESVASRPPSDPKRRRAEDLAMSAQSVSFDAQGRVMVKEKMREMAGLKKDVMFVGRLGHFQIWDLEIYNAEKAGVPQPTVEEVEEELK